MLSSVARIMAVHLRTHHSGLLPTPHTWFKFLAPQIPVLYPAPKLNPKLEEVLQITAQVFELLLSNRDFSAP